MNDHSTQKLIEYFKDLCERELMVQNVPGASIRKVQLTMRDDLCGSFYPRVVLDFYGVPYDWPVDHNQGEFLAEDVPELMQKLPKWAIGAAKAASRIPQYGKPSIANMPGAIEWKMGGDGG